jgi:aerobic carbon-monoxide dehydrogenase small subunit
MGSQSVTSGERSYVKTTVSLSVNGAQRSAEVEPRTLLVQFLRDNAGLTGTHTGCETSQCGACTVLLDGEAVKSCTVLAVQADGHDVTTIEGLAPAGMLHPVQSAFWETNGVQCGFCTPGMVMSVVALLNENANPTDHEIREALEGNICRCTGYQGIVDAVKIAAERVAAGAQPELLANL